MSDERRTDLDSEAGFDSETLRKAFLERRAETESGSATGSGAIAPEAIWDAAAGKGGRGPTLALVDRTLDDPDLALEWSLAKELQRELAQDAAEKAPDDRSAVRPVSVVTRWRRPMAIAASLLLVVVAVFFVVPSTEDPGGADRPIFRETGEMTIRSALAEGEAITIDDPMLRWSPIEDASYTVSVLRPDSLQEIFRASSLDQPMVELPEAVWVDRPADGVVLWRVEATLTSGDQIRSQTFRVRLSEAPAESPSLD